MSDTAHGLGRHGFRNLKSVNWNLGAAALYEEAVRRGEGHVAKNGPLVVRTGIHTGPRHPTSSWCATPARKIRSGGTITRR